MIIDHLTNSGISADIDTMELSMLANSFDVFERMAETCNSTEDGGGFVTIIDTKGGGKMEQVRPEYTIMRNEYSNIMKHSPKFGLTPLDRKKIFGSIEKKKTLDPTGDLD